MKGTKGREQIDPREYIADINPKIDESGWWKTEKHVSPHAFEEQIASLTGYPRVDSLKTVHHR